MTEKDSEQQKKQVGMTNAPSGDPLIGQVLDDKIEIQTLLARGASGSVYRGYHKLLDQLVAIKVLDKRYLSSEKSVQRFVNEAQILSTLANENIVKFFSFGQLADERKYMILEFVEGKTLAQELLDGPLKESAALPIFEQIAAALAYAHSKDVIHRDVKPANVMLSKKEGQSDWQVKLLDFGIFKAIQNEGQNLTQTGLALGSVNYMSPEQCKTQAVDARSDIYSLACLMYEALVGKAPMQDENDLLIMSNHTNKVLKSVPAKYPISQNLERCILRCLEKRPQDRFADCKELIEALRKAASSKAGEQKKETNKNGASRAKVLLLVSVPVIVAGVVLGAKTIADRSIQTSPAAAVHENIGRLPGQITKENLDASEDWLRKCFSSESAQNYKSAELAEVFNNCGQYRLSPLNKEGLPPCAKEVENTLLTRPGSNFRERLASTVALSKLYAINMDYEKAFDTLAKLEAPVGGVSEEESERNSHCLKTFSALQFIFTYQRRVDLLQRLHNELHRYGQKSEDLWTKIYCFQKDASYVYECGDRENATKLAVLAASLLEKYLDKDIIGAGQREVYVELCKLLNNLGQEKLLLKLIEKNNDLSEKAAELDDGLTKVRLYACEAYLELKDYRRAAKLAASVLEQRMKTNPKNEMSDDLAICLLKAKRKLEVSPIELKVTAAKYLHEVRKKCPHRFGISLENINAAFGAMHLNRAELWELLLSDMRLDETPRSEDLRAVYGIYINYLEDKPEDKTGLILRLADKELAVMEEKGIDADADTKTAIHLAQVYSRHGQFQKARKALSYTDRYYDMASASVRFERDCTGGLILKDEHKFRESAASLRQAFDKRTVVSKLSTYTDIALTLGWLYGMQLKQQEDARVCMERAYDLVSKYRPNKRDEQMNLLLALSNVYIATHAQAKLQDCRAKIAELRPLLNVKEETKKQQIDSTIKNLIPTANHAEPKH